MKMENCGSMLKSALVVIVVMTVIQSGSAAEKLASCCTSVSRQVITEPILDYMIQQADLPCVKAVIFQTKSGLFCMHGGNSWVRSKVFAIQKARVQAAAASSVRPSSPVSLLSIITSTASSPSSSSLPPSSSSSLTPSSSSLPLSSSSSLTPSFSSLPPSSSSSSLSPSSSSLPPSSSSSSTSETPAGETFSISSQ